MFLGNGFGKSLDILQRTMDASVLRENIIANNIANANTPNFKASFLNFETSLKAALDSENTPDTFSETLTDPRHIPFNRVIDYQTVMPRKYLDYTTTSKNNGNNVDIEEQTMLHVNNQLAYNLMARSVGDMFNNVSIVLK